MDVGTLEIWGFLKWDDNVDGIRLSSNFILVKPLGRFRVRTQLRNFQKHYLIIYCLIFYRPEDKNLGENMPLPPSLLKSRPPRFSYVMKSLTGSSSLYD